MNWKFWKRNDSPMPKIAIHIVDGDSEVFRSGLGFAPAACLIEHDVHNNLLEIHYYYPKEFAEQQLKKDGELNILISNEFIHMNVNNLFGKED